MITKTQKIVCDECKREWLLQARPSWLLTLKVTLEGEGGAVLLSKDVCSQECAAEALRALDEKLAEQPIEIGVWREEEELEEAGFSDRDPDDSDEVEDSENPWATYEDDEEASDAAGLLETGD